MFCLMIPVAVMAGEEVLPPTAGLPIIDWHDAVGHVDKQVIVQGRIV